MTLPVRRLPSRKRPRREYEGADNDASQTAAAVTDGNREPAAVLPLLIMPDLIGELLENGSVAPHVKRLLLAGHRSSWRSHHGVIPEIEFGTNVAAVEPTAPTPTADERQTAGVGAAVPFLLRAFRRAQPPVAPAATPAAVSHCLRAPQSVDDWAPMSLVHVAKALRGCGLSLRGPRVCFQTIATVNVAAGGQRYTVSRRHQHILGSAPGDRSVVTNHKAKYQVPVHYPGQASEIMHLALEHNAATGGDVIIGDGLVVDAQQCGVLPARLCGSSGPVGRSARVKCEWESPPEEQPLLRVVIQLHFAIPEGTAVDVFHNAVLAAPRPKNHADVPRWLAAVGCSGPAAEWRVEVEMVPPVHPSAITQGLFLHHLVRQTVRPTGACLPRSTFAALYQRHCHGSRDVADAAYARGLLRDYCDAIGVPPNLRRSDGGYYPLQPRPYDLVTRYLDRLLRCVVTPKADGLEAFLIGHSRGTALIPRTGVVRCFLWRSATAPGPYPFVLEGELLGDGELFVAYDCPMSPTVCYGATGRYATRHAAAEALVRRLDGRIPANGPVVRCKPCFPVAHNPHAAIRRCTAWARTVGLPCDGVVFVDDGLPGYARGERLWKLKDAPTIDFAVNRAPPPRMRPRSRVCTS